MLSKIFYCMLAYLSGSVLYASLLGTMFGVDPRKAGADGNPGATNAFRAGGVTLGTPVLLLDFLKGFLPVFLFFEKAGPLQPLLALAPVVGHVFPVFHRFQGGKGIATTFGIWSALTYWVIPSVLGTTFSLFLVLKHFTGFTIPDHLGVMIGMLHASGWVALLYRRLYLTIAFGNLALLLLAHRQEFKTKGENHA
jgi:glycerol-3-phosphate acyltransferase PlsY